MEQYGIFNQNIGLDDLGFEELKSIHWNLSEPRLYEHSLCRGETTLAAGGALVAITGQHTGRSAQDKFIVEDDTTRDSVWWDNAKSMDPGKFETLYQDFLEHAKGRDVFVQDLIGGADAKNKLATRIVTEFAWHSLFIRNLLIRPQRSDLATFDPEFTIIDFPNFRAHPERHGCRTETVIACDFTRKIVLIGGTSYAGEIKKSVFSFLNFLLPSKGVMPMHCSANVGPDDDAAVFFGLSGTGKTTLSADPSRTLIGDDEHGWGENGIFNFEGGCYAKTIRLSKEAEPEIYATTQRFGTVLENVVLDEDRNTDFDDASLTENTRCAYPLHFIPNASDTGITSHPKNIIMLTADAFGILPPVSRLNPAQAMYHFLSGYTAKVAGTEKGVTEPEATFSTCFGAPFMPRHPSVYGNLLRDLIARHEVNCWLVNTGWTGGTYGIGSRMPLKATRTMLIAALDGTLNNSEFRIDPNFGFEVPLSIEGVDDAILDPRSTWSDPRAYDTQAHGLVEMFIDNFAKFESHVDVEVLSAAPFVRLAAE
ncbi:MAG: phosphoenolpyruvate carboxykinase [Rhizobiaceae bacterium]|nr:phosphoenolpyruvate carboxykinase [Rhizobiaceae bacterium]